MKVVKKKTIRKKLIKAIICTVITAGSMCNAFATVPICAASAIGEFANVVVLVRFKGDMQGDNGTGFNKPYNSTIANAPRTYWESLIRNLTESTTNSELDRLRSICGIFPADSIWSNRCSRKRTATD